MFISNVPLLHCCCVIPKVLNNNYVLSAGPSVVGNSADRCKTRPSVLLPALLILATSLHTVQSKTNLLTYSGDYKFPKDDDCGVGIDLNVNFPFFGKIYNRLYINTNGDVTFNGIYKNHVSADFPIPDNTRPIIAIWWADVNTNKGGEVYYRQTTRQHDLEQVTQQIQAVPGCAYSDFTASWALIVTWYQVAHHKCDLNPPEKVPGRNTFQLSLVVDASEANSFSIFNYDRLEWTAMAMSGFDAGDETNYKALPGSRSDAVINLIHTTNAGSPGLWVFKISDSSISGKVILLYNFYVVDVTKNEILNLIFKSYTRQQNKSLSILVHLLIAVTHSNVQYNMCNS